MTVELAVVLPVAIVVAAIAMNALLFFSECAAFDRKFPNAVRVYAAAPAYGETAGGNTGLVQEHLRGRFAEDHLAVDVTSVSQGFLIRFDATLTFTPTLFGMGLRESVMGVSLPRLTHRTSFVIDPYKPGVIA